MSWVPEGHGSGASLRSLVHVTYQVKPQSSQTPAAAAAKSLQSGPTLCDPTDGSPPGSAVPGILQAGTLEWVAIFFSPSQNVEA